MANVIRNPGSVDLTATAYYSTAALPSAGDNLYLAEGSDVIVTNMTALQAIDLLGFYVAPQCGSTFPTTAISLTVDQGGTGTFRYEGKANGTLKVIGGTDNDINKIQWLPANGARGEFDAMDILTDVEQDGGSLYIGSTALFGASSVFWGLGGDALVDYHATDVLPTAHVKKGQRLTVKRAFTQIIVEVGGELTIDIEALTGTTVDNKGGTVIWISGIVTNMNNDSGILDDRRFRKVGQSAVNYRSSHKAVVLASPGAMQPTLGSSTVTTVGGRGASVIMGSGTGGGTGFGTG